MPHQTTLFALNLMQYQTRLQISHVKNIGNVFELSSVAFRLAPPYDGLLLQLSSWLEKRFRPPVVRVRPGYDGKYRFRSYRFVVGQNLDVQNAFAADGTEAKMIG